MKLKLLSLGITTILLFSGCKKGIVDYILPPNNFFFQILKDGQRLPDSVLDNMDFYYFDKKGKKINSRIRNEYERNGEEEKLFNDVDILGWYPKENELKHEGVRLSLWVNNFGIEYNTWYFEYPDGDIDTLEVESVKVSSKIGSNDPCYCNSPFSTIKYNGKNVNTHPTLKGYKGKNIYVLAK